MTTTPLNGANDFVAGAVLHTVLADGTAVPVSSINPVPMLGGITQSGNWSVGGVSSTSQVTPAVQAASYASGASIGGLLSFTNAARAAAGSGLIQACTASFASGVQPTMDVVFFNATPSGSTVTDKTAVSVATADLSKVIGVIHLSDFTLLGISAPSFGQAQQQSLPFTLPSGTTVYAVVIARSAITLTSTSDMTASIRILQD
jgi:hypothetical protein